ncbi:hypothetical protein RSOLAG22IIIB_12373 [Rhizoctonia solani]|uniref:Uncharacterized protein n=1 Tax=Rhizoctonia solani TaxID=456999 RepID=A0A0K6GD76_9AGAM|nr:hypothetical protein RSOLAG22IIIB_12373 [Rhizoctonia solani]
MRFDLFTALACVLSLLLPCTLALNTPAPNLAVAEIRAVPEDLALSPRDSDVMLEPERFDLETSTASDWSGLSRLDARATCRSGYGGVAAELESVAELVNGAMAVDVAGTINMDVMIRDAAPRTQIAAREVDAAQKAMGTLLSKHVMNSGEHEDVYNPSSGKTMNADPTQLIQASAALGALALAFYVLPYLLDPYDYRRRFPGPPLARFTNWWMSSLTRTGHHSEIVQRLHEKYGTFVRLGPNHISIADPDALETIYGHGSGLLKSEFYHVFQNAPTTDVFNTTDRAEHSSKPIYSKP